MASSGEEALERLRSSSHAKSIGETAMTAIDRLRIGLGKEVDFAGMNNEELIDLAGGLDSLVLQFYILSMICGAHPDMLMDIRTDLEELREPLQLLLGDAADRRSFIDLHRDHTA